jgi:hypothetical protein
VFGKRIVPFWIFDNKLVYNDLMDEIQQKVRKASQFVDNFIKGIIFLSFILFLGCFYIYIYQSGEIYKNQVMLCDTVWSQGMTEQNPLDNPIQEAFLSVKNNCFENAGRTSQLWGKMAFIALDITVLLPIVYFGGKKVVKDTSDRISSVNSYL